MPKRELNKKDALFFEELAYEPFGAPTERALRLKKEREAEEERQNSLRPQTPTRHKNLPAEDLFAIKTNLSSNSRRTPLDYETLPITLQDKDNSQSNDSFRFARRRMVNEQLIARGIIDQNVLKAMGSIPRHLFVSEALHATAYDDRPLPIASGQTISQPYVVALMCQLLLAEPKMRVLEVGTGSGYQAAVLHEMGLQVLSVERLQTLYEKTSPLLKHTFGYKNMTLSLSDGTLGWKRHAPFDRIIVAAGGPTVPDALKDQLADGGIMLIPVGAEHQKQRIVRVFKINGKCREEDCGAVAFVDLIGKNAWR